MAIVLALPETLASKVDADAKQPWLQWPPFGQRATLKKPVATSNTPSAREALADLVKNPTVMVSSVNTALIFGSYFCLAVSFPTLLEGTYGFNMVEIGLSYLAPGRSKDQSLALFRKLGQWLNDLLNRSGDGVRVDLLRPPQ